MLCFGLLFWSATTEAGLMMTNLFFGMTLALFGATLAYGIYLNFRYVGYMYQTSSFGAFGVSWGNTKRVDKGSMRYSIITLLVFVLGVALFLFGSSIIVASVVFKCHFLKAS